jgi:glycosyltransferase involved in cell wall biosynthesis
MLRVATNDYGTYVDNPKDKDEVAHAIKFIIDNQSFIKSQVENGLHWVSQISWDQAILKTTNLINKIKN